MALENPFGVRDQSKAVLKRRKKSVTFRSFPKNTRGHTCVGGGRLAVGGWWWLAAAGGWGWWLMAVGGWQLVAAGGWQLVAVVVGGGWWLAVDGPLGRSLRAVLNKKKSSPLKTPLDQRRLGLQLSHKAMWQRA